MEAEPLALTVVAASAAVLLGVYLARKLSQPVGRYRDADAPPRNSWFRRINEDTDAGERRIVYGLVALWLLSFSGPFLLALGHGTTRTVGIVLTAVLVLVMATPTPMLITLRRRRIKRKEEP